MAQDDAMKAERERQEAATEVWEERNDGVGNKFWVNQKTKQTLLEHPVQRAKRNAMHNAERARMRDPVRGGCLSLCVGTHTRLDMCVVCYQDYVPPTALEVPRVRRGSKEKVAQPVKPFTSVNDPGRKKIKVSDLIKQDRQKNKVRYSKRRQPRVSPCV